MLFFRAAFRERSSNENAQGVLPGRLDGRGMVLRLVFGKTFQMLLKESVHGLPHGTGIRMRIVGLPHLDIPGGVEFAVGITCTQVTLPSTLDGERPVPGCS